MTDTDIEPLDLRLAATGGVRLGVRLRNPHGSGTPVLLVHGLASNARLWDGVARRLAATGFPVAAVDQRGHGGSDKPDTGYDFATLADDLAAVAAGLGWGDRRVAVAGQSWGGNVVVELAARHPEMVAVLVLVDGGTIDMSSQFADLPTAEVTLAPPDFTGTRLADFSDMLHRMHPDWPEEGIEGTLANVEVLPDGTVRPWLAREHHMTILRAMWEQHPMEVMRSVRTPVLIVPAGDPDRPSPARYEASKRDAISVALAALPHGAVRWVDGDHDLHAQHPDVIAGLIAAAIDGTAFSGE